MRHLRPQHLGAASFNPAEDRMISTMRLILAVAALAITRIDPMEPSRFAAATYLILFLYFLYGLSIHLVVLRGRQFPLLLQHSLHWIDVLFYVALIGLSYGTNSIFFVLLFFPIIVASFRWGFWPGMRVTIVSVVLYVIVGYAARPPSPEFDLDRFILRLSALPILGYLIAYWGGYELRLKQRLELLKEISTISNPRFGIDRTLGTNMEKLRAFYNADYCIAVLPEPDGGPFHLRRATKKNPADAVRPQPISVELARTLMSFGEKEAVYFRFNDSRSRSKRVIAVSMSAQGEPREHADEAQSSAVAEALDTRYFLTVPMRSRNRTIGRLFLTSERSSFKMADLGFLLQIVENIMPVIENIILVDRMATRAAEEERRRIAQDIHDRIIQPYIGLQLGIASARELCELTPPGENLVPLLKERTSKLHELAAVGIADLREYVQRLKYGEGLDGGLVQGLQRYASRFFEATGIEVEVKAIPGFHVNDRLAAEVFSMAVEAMSNIRRHTHALHGTIELTTANDRLAMRIENETGADAVPEAFVPQSISHRAAALQGDVKIEIHEDGVTAVIIEIPL